MAAPAKTTTDLFMCLYYRFDGVIVLIVLPYQPMKYCSK